jgi:acyl carrier protein
LRPEDCPETLRGWDSTKQIEIVVAIEDAYGIELTTAEILSLRSIGAIVEVLRKRGCKMSP